MQAIVVVVAVVTGHTQTACLLVVLLRLCRLLLLLLLLAMVGEICAAGDAPQSVGCGERLRVRVRGGAGKAGQTGERSERGQRIQARVRVVGVRVGRGCRVGGRGVVRIDGLDGVEVKGAWGVVGRRKR